MPCICTVYCLLYIYCFSPPSSPVDPATAAADVLEYYYVDDPTPIAELPGKQNPFPSPRYRLSVCIILALGIAAVATIVSYSAAYPIFVACYCTLPYPMLPRHTVYTCWPYPLSYV